ncbi:MAG TPA: hypothetical protein VK985_13780, partial [Rariglobus sp.]|nr:hypothetical protein [Rariglobus sp.]
MPIGISVVRHFIFFPNVLDETDACLARQVRSSWRDKHASCLWRLVRLRGFHLELNRAFNVTSRASNSSFSDAECENSQYTIGPINGAQNANAIHDALILSDELLLR